MPSRKMPVGVAFQDFLLQQRMHLNSSSGVIYAQGDSDMPLVRIDLSKNASKERIRAVSDAVYGAMVELANVPLHDKFQIITRHADDEIIYPEEGYLGSEYSPDLFTIPITCLAALQTSVTNK